MSQLTAIFLACLVTFETASAQSEPQDFHDSSRWNADMEGFAIADKGHRPPENAILFVGSSSIRLWDLKRSFPSLVTINRGFGGSHLADSVQFIDRVVLKYKPLTCVLYAGDNDLHAGKSPERVFADFAEFVAILQRHLPDTTLHYISIKPSVARWEMVDRVRRTNELIRSYCELNDNLFFVDISSLMLNAEGTPNQVWFVADGLHLNEAGYQLWSEKLMESLNQPGGLGSSRSSIDRK